MNDREIQKLVDSYLLRQISPEDNARLLERIEADPLFAQYVKECEETIRVLKLARDRELRQKLKAWDTIDSQPRKGKGKRLWMLFIVLSVFMSAWCWLTYHFSPSTMAMSSFNAVNEMVIPHYKNNSSVKEWELGTAAFRQQDFENAMLHFISISEASDTSMDMYVRWNVLLCQLAMSGPTEEWSQPLDELSKDIPEPVRSAAEQLQHKIRSPLYTYLFRGAMHHSITSIKPKIM